MRDAVNRLDATMTLKVSVGDCSQKTLTHNLLNRMYI